MIRERKKSRRKPVRNDRGKSAAPHSNWLAGFIERGARALNLKVDTLWLPAIGEHLLVTLRHARNVEDFVLPDEIDPAPVFEP